MRISLDHREFKLGPVRIQLGSPPTIAAAAAKPVGRPSSGEIGGTGTSMSGGRLIEQDYNRDLQTPEAYAVYDRMYRSDAQVKAGLSVITLPILAASWFIEPASDSPKDKKIAEFVENNLIKGMSTSWPTYLRHVLMKLRYGSMPFEKVWEFAGGEYRIRKLAPRMPKSVREWLVDENGGLAGIEQAIWRRDSYDTVVIPVDKLLVFVNDQEGSDFRGISLLRAAYKHWYYKDHLYRVDAIAKERRAIGVDVMKLMGGDINKTKQREAELALMTLHAHEKQFLTEIDGLHEYRIEGITGQIVSCLESIQHHDLLILRSMLAEFLAMGGTDSGSFAMHADKTSFFLLAMRAITDEIKWAHNEYLIKAMVDYNFAGVTEYPRLEHSRLDTRPIGDLAEAINKLMTVGAITPDWETENNLREVLELPPKPEPEPEPEPVVPPTDPNAPLPPVDPSQDPNAPITQPGQQPPAPNQPAVPPPPGQSSRHSGAPDFAKHIDFAGIERALDDAEDQVVAAVKRVQAKQIGKLVQVGADIFRKRDARPAEDVDIPFRSEIAVAVADVLKKLYREGQSEVNREVRASDTAFELPVVDPDDPGNSIGVDAFLGVRSRSLANLMGDRLKSAFMWEILDQLKEGEFLADKLKSALTDLSDREIRRASALIVTEALNMGRQSAAGAVKNHIRRVVYTSVLDQGTCSACRQADGKEFAYGSNDMDRYRTPYGNCEGKGRCRCVLVYEMK